MLRSVKAGLVLLEFALMQLENLHNNFQFNMIWQRRSMPGLFFSRRLEESDVTVKPLVTCMDILMIQSCSWKICTIIFSLT